MSASVTKAGPYFSTGEIKFSSLRLNFLENSSGSISVSSLKRNTSTSITDPVLPDCTENRTSGPLGLGVASSNNLKISQLRGTIKAYYITQTGTDQNFLIDSQSWNGNLTTNVRKVVYINGTCGSNTTATPAVRLTTTACNVTIDVSGNIHGAGAAGGTLATISGLPGGDALSVQGSGSNNILVFVRETSQIYGGGGGGEKGAYGATGTSGTCNEAYTAENCDGCPGCPDGWTASGCWSGGACSRRRQCNWWGNCWWVDNAWQKYVNCSRSYVISGGAGGEGGNGGPGRGYNYLSGSLAGAGGAGGAPSPGCGAGPGNTGETGATGGEWGNNGNDTTYTGGGGVSGRAITGTNYTISGTVNSSTVKGSFQPS
jgi:hypothetical protein